MLHMTAAEPITLTRAAEFRKKLESKSLDAIVLNDVSKPGIGFDSDANAVTILTRDHQIEVPQASKSEVAEHILKFTAELKKNPRLSIAK